MYFHGKIILHSSQYLTFSNESEQTALQDYLIPFINGQVIECDNGTEKVLVNMKSAVICSIYKSSEKVDVKEFEAMNSNGEIPKKYKDMDCTIEYIEKVKEIQSHPAIKSLLEMAFMPPQKQIFVIMKFGDELLNSAYEGVIKPLAQEFGLNIIRVDEIQNAGKINDQILESIAKSCLILADLSGERPNCYYETGFAHALGKNIILTIHQDSQIHFDLSNHRFIQWNTEKSLREQLKIRLQALFPDNK